MFGRRSDCLSKTWLYSSQVSQLSRSHAIKRKCILAIFLTFFPSCICITPMARAFFLSFFTFPALVFLALPSYYKTLTNTPTLTGKQEKSPSRAIKTKSGSLSRDWIYCYNNRRGIVLPSARTPSLRYMYITISPFYPVHAFLYYILSDYARTYST